MPRVHVCTIAKGEHRYIQEFVLYYLRGLGFDHVFVYDNEEAPTYEAILSKKVTVRHFPGKKKQLQAFNDCLQKLQTSDPDAWCAFFDIDEFLVLKKDTDIHAFLKNYANFPAVVVHWYIFGDSGRDTYTAEPVTSRFLQRGRSVNDHYKSIVQVKHAQLFKDNPHACSYTSSLAAVNTNNDPVTEYSFANGPVDRAVLHHYFGKTWQEFTDTKLYRGRASTSYQSPEAERDMLAGLFKFHNLNEVYDDSAKRVYKRALYASYDSPSAVSVILVVISIIFIIVLLIVVTLPMQ